MPASQLKRLKASLREQGVIGPQQSKKQKKKNAQDERGRNEKRLERGAALERIREQFNPFQFKTNARGPKFPVTTDKAAKDRMTQIQGRPGVSKTLSEERRRETLLVEMQRRNKVGGLFDRRFGEGDPTMTPEALAAQRFAMEKQRSHKKAAMFDLDVDTPSGVISLTHGGKSLDLNGEDALRDDFDESVSDDGSEMSDLQEHNRKRLKRLREQVASFEEEEGEAGEGAPERKKSKKEVMEEVIAKSKLHKYERQAAKEEDEDLRKELDSELADIQQLLYHKTKTDTRGLTENGVDVKVKSALIAGVEKDALEKDYDVRVKQMAADRRAKPTMRTKTEEEKAEDEANHLRELEEKRAKRMRGEQENSEDEDDSEESDAEASKPPAVQMIIGDEDGDDFGLGKGIKRRPTATELGFDDEDDFVIDDDLVASGSDMEPADVEDSEESDDDGHLSEDHDDDDDEGEEEFIKGLLTEKEAKDPIFGRERNGRETGAAEDGLPYIFPCPQSHAELLGVLDGIPLSKLSIVVQRIRALYHPKLLGENKEKLANFSRALVRHVAYLGTLSESDLFPSLEMLIRHIHSLAKMFPIEIAKEFRSQLEELGENRPLSLGIGDLFVLTAIGTIFPTSDHFHQVVTPALLAMGRYLGQKVPGNLADYATGTYLLILAVQYQNLSKRYIPEVMNFCLNTLCSLAPEKSRERLGFFPVHEPNHGMRTKGAKKVPVRPLCCKDCRYSEETLPDAAASSLKVAIVCTNVSVLTAAAEVWKGKPSFYETFEPARKVLQHLSSKTCRQHFPDALIQSVERAAAHIARALKVATLSRRPLELHHHRPLAIKTYIPRFEDDFDPDKHYDPDRERAELAKLKAEHKKERKGAMRELRKDAKFVAREKLRIKKEKDAAYEKKFKRLVAEIQGEEGHAANEYERERKLRKKARNR